MSHTGVNYDVDCGDLMLVETIVLMLIWTGCVCVCLVDSSCCPLQSLLVGFLSVLNGSVLGSFTGWLAV